MRDTHDSHFSFWEKLILGFRITNAIEASDEDRISSEMVLREQIKHQRAEVRELKAETEQLKAEIELLKAKLGIDLAEEEKPAEEQPARPTPEPAPEPVAEQPKTLQDVLQHAALFQTDSGMVQYLNRTMPELTEEEQENLQKLLSRSPEEIREEIKRLVEA